MQPGPQVAAHGVTEPEAGRDVVDGLLACRRLCQRLDEQLDEVEHLDVAVAQRLRERVVLVLGSADPGDAVEEQAVVVAGGQSLELGTGSMQASPYAAGRPHCRHQDSLVMLGPSALERRTAAEASASRGRADTTPDDREAPDRPIPAM